MGRADVRIWLHGSKTPQDGRDQAKRHRRGARLSLALGGVASLSLLLAACGARVGPYLGAQSDIGQGASTSGANTQGASTTTTSTTLAASGTPTSSVTSSGSPSGATSAGGSTSAHSTGGQPTASAAALTPSNFNFNPAAEAAYCPNATGNTSSDQGVTPTSITFGNVSGLTGPLTNSFNQGSQAVQALFSAIDADGGICGRKLLLDVEDDGQNSTTNSSDVADLISKHVFAFAGSTSDADNGGVNEMVQANVPDVGFSINCNRSEAPVYWSAEGGSCYEQNGVPYIADSVFALAKANGYFPTRMAFLSYNIPISAQAAEEYEYVYQKLGGTVCYSDFSVSPATASLEGDVEQMQANNCNGVLTTVDVTGNAKLLQSLQQQNVKLSYVATTFDGYTPAQISLAGEQAAQGLIVDIPFIPFNEPNPIIELYQQELATYEPGDQASGFGITAWESAQMLIYALIQSGHNPTRASVTKVFNSLTNWDGGGSLGPYTPSTHSVSTCDVDVSVQGNAFLRKAPASGLYCGGRIVQAGT
jgi:ABC-type branched-subunit amino acid transport system substrate-binding protein